MAGSRSSSGAVVTIAAVIVIIAGVRAAAPIVVPFLLSVFLAIILTPPFLWLLRKNIPVALALVIVLVVLAAAAALFSVLIGASLDDFLRTLPTYQERLKNGMTQLITWANARGVELSRLALLNYLDPAKAMGFIANLLSSMGNILANGFLIFLTVVFIMLEVSNLPAKCRSALRDPDTSMMQFSSIIEDINRYMEIKTLLSLLTGILVAISLAVIGVDYYLLWGTLAFLLNYIPNIGSVLAAVPAVLVAVLQLGPFAAMSVVLVYVVINIVVGTILEPRFMGRGLGLSPLVVFLSLVFWGWVLGPVGMLLSVPLTISAKIALHADADSRWIALMLGPGPEPKTNANHDD